MGVFVLLFVFTLYIVFNYKEVSYYDSCVAARCPKSVDKSKKLKLTHVAVARKNKKQTRPRVAKKRPKTNVYILGKY